jgi:hypothetical protein
MEGDVWAPHQNWSKWKLFSEKHPNGHSKLLTHTSGHLLEQHLHGDGRTRLGDTFSVTWMSMYFQNNLVWMLPGCKANAAAPQQNHPLSHTTH